MTDREVMKMVFDALEGYKKDITDNGAMPENWDSYYPERYDALEALRQALAQPKQEPVAWMMPDYGDVLSASEADGTGIYNIPLYTAPQKYCPSENNAAYEKGFVEGMAKQMDSSIDRAVNAMVNPQMMQIKDGKMSYLKKPWVGLTDDDHKDFANRTKLLPILAKTLAEFIEAKLKERNEN